MAKLQQTTRLKGFRDILSDDWEYWDYVLRVSREVVQTAGFDRIEIPTLEKASLFNKSVGEETDIVMKEMYVFDTSKMGEKKVTKKEKEDALVALRPELTAGIVRAYIENGMHTMPKPVSLYTIGKCFRHDKPQAGRYREFTQFDVEVFGKSESIIDANLISVFWGIFEKLKVKDLELHINSIGCSECRPKTRKILTEFLKRKQNKLCEDCKKRLKKNPLRILDCKNEKCQTIAASAPIAIDSVCEDCKNHFMAVLEYLDDMEIPYSLTPTLVRGLDYYNRTVFEITSKNEKRQNALGGGGRYDYLIERMGGDSTSAIGFAIGLDRLAEYMKE